MARKPAARPTTPRNKKRVRTRNITRGQTLYRRRRHKPAASQTGLTPSAGGAYQAASTCLPASGTAAITGAAISSLRLNQRAALKELSVEEVVRGYLFRRQRARVGSFQVGKDNFNPFRLVPHLSYPMAKLRDHCRPHSPEGMLAACFFLGIFGKEKADGLQNLLGSFLRLREGPPRSQRNDACSHDP